MTFTTRFAPSPTGPLHLGHAFSALLASDLAARAKGEFLLRIEDIDQSRARAHWERQIYEDLTWLGLSWPAPVRRQSEHLPAYRAAVVQLWQLGVLYPCACSRADIRAAVSAPQEGALPMGPDGLIYPGTCRNRPRPATAPTDLPLRLDLSRALDLLQQRPLGFTETGAGPEGQSGRINIPPADLPHSVGDIVITRREMGTSYHLSVVIDDHVQAITHVVRGQDLFEATQIHVILQHLLEYPTPTYHHHRLIRDDQGKRLAKRDDARALSKYRSEGRTPQDIRAMVGL